MGVDINDPDTYEIKSIIDSYASQSQQKFKYLVKWKGWPDKFNTKKPVEYLTNCAEIIWMFYKLNPGKSQPPNYIHKRLSLQELT